MTRYQSDVSHQAIKLQSTRWLFVLLLAVVTSACTTPAGSSRSLGLTQRGGNAEIYGVVSHEFPRTTRITVDINRRIYMGNAEPVAPNETYGFAHKYGSRTPAAAAPLDGNLYYKATLSSADNHVLRCDLVYNEGGQRDGICVDDFERIYDALLSTQRPLGMN